MTTKTRPAALVTSKPERQEEFIAFTRDDLFRLDQTHDFFLGLSGLFREIGGGHEICVDNVTAILNLPMEEFTRLVREISNRFNAGGAA